MNTASAISTPTLRAWGTRLIPFLPLWLFSLAITAEGFPRPPIPPLVAGAAFVLAIVVSLVSLWQGWTALEIVVVSLCPLLLLGPFDEISTTYKTPFILLCALVLTGAIAGYQASHSSRPARALILLAAGLVTLWLAWHAAANFWQMAGDLGYGQCFPDGFGCAPLAGRGTPWWLLFFAP